MGELACLAVNADHREWGLANPHAHRNARQEAGIKRLFVPHDAHRALVMSSAASASPADELPEKKRDMYQTTSAVRRCFSRLGTCREKRVAPAGRNNPAAGRRVGGSGLGLWIGRNLPANSANASSNISPSEEAVAARMDPHARINYQRNRLNLVDCKHRKYLAGRWKALFRRRRRPGPELRPPKA